MMGLSLWQPWATLMAIGVKRIETRSWSTDYRGPVAIHAAKKWTRELQRFCQQDHIRIPLAQNNYATGSGRELPLGCVVAVANLVRCDVIRGRCYPAPIAREFLYGDYTPGRFAWYFEDIQPCREPVPLKGRQGLWEISEGGALISGEVRGMPFVDHHKHDEEAQCSAIKRS